MSEGNLERSAGESPSVFSLFRSFFLISALTIGGGYAMVPVICDALTKRKWMSEAEFWDLFSTAQSLPGPMALTTALICGARLRKIPGAVAAFFGIMLPPFGSIVLVGWTYRKIGSIPQVQYFLSGASFTIPGLVAAVLWRLLKQVRWSWGKAVFCLASCASLIIFSRFAIPIFFGIALLSWLEEKGEKQ